MKIVNGLPEEEAREILDFARFLKAQAGDRERERIISSCSAVACRPPP